MFGAFIALFPFDVLVYAEGAPPQTVMIDGHWATIYWPFGNEAAPTRPVAQVRAHAIPRRLGDPWRITAPLQIHPAVQPPPGCVFANALRLDIETDPGNTEPARMVTRRFLSQIRRRTAQWWIGRERHEGEGMIRNAFVIDESGRIRGNEIRTEVRVEAHFEEEHPLSPAEFVEACRAIDAGQDVPIHWDVFYDAVYFFIHEEDVRRAVMEAAIACDLAIVHETLRAGNALGKPEQAIRRNLSDRDLLKNLREALPRLFGPAIDFQKQRGADYAQIQRLWAARGQVAHGLAPAAGAHGKGALPTGMEFAEMLRSARTLLRWLELIAPV